MQATKRRKAALRRTARSRARDENAANSAGRHTLWTVWRLWQAYILTETGKAIAQADKSNIKHLAPLYNRLASKLTTADIEELKQRLLATPCKRNATRTLAPQSVKHVLGLLQRMVRFAVRQGYFAYPTRLHFAMPVLDNLKTECMSHEQMERYMAALEQEPDPLAAAYLRMALMTGIRKGALLALQWSDIDFDRAFITLRGSAAKSGRTSHVPLTAPVREILLQIPRGAGPFVFTGRHGRRHDFRRAAERARDRAGLPRDFRPVHGLRHAYASFLASSGKVDLYTLQKLLTHGSPQMTQRYAHLADEALQRAAAVAEGMLVPVAKPQS